MASCRGCPQRWTNLAWAHCSACHKTFTGVTYFDQHRFFGTCVRAETDERGRSLGALGLFESEGVFSTEEGHEKRLKGRAQMEAAHAARRKSG